MINVPNWEERKQHYEEYWNMKNSTPVIYLAGMAANSGPIDIKPEKPDDIWFNADYNIRLNRAWYENTYYGLDAYPYVSPTLGNDLISAILGLEVIYNETSAWIVHSDDELEDIRDLKLDRNHFMYKKMKEILTAYAEDAKNGDYIVGMVDLNTLLDGVASMVGPEHLCYSMVDEPDEVKRLIKEHFNVYKELYSDFEPIVTKYQKGSTNWLSVYSEIPWYFISIDAMVMISGDFFDEFVAGPLSDMIDFHERTLFHLDGENAVIHLDRILEQKKLTGVQVQATPFRQSAELWIPYLKKIQKAGKTMWVEARHKQDVEDYIKNLDPEGMFLRVWTDTEEEAKDIEKMVNDYYGIKK